MIYIIGNPEDDEVSCSDNDLAKVESVVASLQDLNGDTNAADCQGMLGINL